jgi:hypothetical protein
MRDPLQFRCVVMIIVNAFGLSLFFEHHWIALNVAIMAIMAIIVIIVIIVTISIKNHGIVALLAYVFHRGADCHRHH